MKKIFLLFSFCFLTCLMFGQTNCTISVSGMKCAHGCAKKVENGLKNIDGVNSVKVDFDNQKAFVVFDESKITDKELVSSVSKIGFKAKLIEEKNKKRSRK